MAKIKIHPCILCTNSRWNKLPSGFGIDKPIFKTCISDKTPNESCPDFNSVNSSCIAVIMEGLDRCHSTGE